MVAPQVNHEELGTVERPILREVDRKWLSWFKDQFTEELRFLRDN